MPIANATILDGGVLAVTAGTSRTLTLDGVNVSNGVHLSDFSATDPRLRPSVSVKNRPAVYNKQTGTWTRRKSEAVFTFPKLLPSGLIDFPNVRIIIEDTPEMTDAELVRMLNWPPQMFIRPDFVAFIKTGVTA